MAPTKNNKTCIFRKLLEFPLLFPIEPFSKELYIWEKGVTSSVGPLRSIILFLFLVIFYLNFWWLKFLERNDSKKILKILTIKWQIILSTKWFWKMISIHFFYSIFLFPFDGCCLTVPFDGCCLIVPFIYVSLYSTPCLSFCWTKV